MKNKEREKKREERKMIMIDTSASLRPSSSSPQKKKIIEPQQVREEDIQLKMEDFYKRILAWDFEKLDDNESEKLKGTIPRTFNSYNHYIKSFLPLFYLECLECIKKAKADIKPKTNP